jgi:tight adherence protein B
MRTTSAPRHTRRRVRVLGGVAAVVTARGLLAGWTASAGAQGGDALQIRQVDTTDPSGSTLTFLTTAGADAVDDTVLTDNGSDVTGASPQPLAGNAKLAVALVFDTSSAMDDTGGLVAAKEAADGWLAGRSAEEKANQLVAVYAASGTATRIQDFTSDPQRIAAAIDRVAPPAEEVANDQTALWGAIQQAGDGLAAHDDHQANIVVMTGSSDNVGGNRAVANGAVTTAGASIFAVELLSPEFNGSSLNGLVEDHGGLVFTTEVGTELDGLVEQAGQAIDDHQFTMSFAPATDAGSVADLVLQVGDTTATAAVTVGSSVVGASSLDPEVITSSGGISFLQGPLGMLLMVVLGAVAAVGLAYGVIMIFVREDRLSTALRPYDDALAATGAEDDPQGSALAKTAIIQRAVQITEQVAEQRGFLSRAEAALERANLPLRAGEALFFYASVVIVGTLLALVLTRSVVLGLIVGFLAALGPIAAVSFLAAKRRKAFMAQLPDMLSLLAGTLRAGYSLMQGVEAVSQEVAEPMGLELRRVVTESRLGRPLEEALDGVGERMGSPDFAWAVMAIRIQREVGGNLSELLLTVADTMVQRERLRRDVAALTAEGRVSAYVLIALPIGLGLVMFAMNREYTEKLLTTTLGNVLLGLAVVSATIGYFWMRKIINIKL